MNRCASQKFREQNKFGGSGTFPSEHNVKVFAIRKEGVDRQRCYMQFDLHDLLIIISLPFHGEVENKYQC